MASAKEIQNRIKSVKDTRKITNAMYMISSSKLKRAKKVLEDTEPYFFALRSAIARVLRHVPDMEHRYFDTRPQIQPEDRKIGYILVSGDKGLAGAYNHNVFKMAEERISGPGNYRLFVLGEVGRQYFAKKQMDVDTNFRYTVQKPTMHRARQISEKMIDLYLTGKLDEVYIIYTQMVNSVTMEAEAEQLLPLNKVTFNNPDMARDMAAVHQEEIQFTPSPYAVIDSIVPNYLSGMIYSCLVESYASEHNSRMMAMEAATSSADEMLKNLSVQYNRVRQAAITQEITEVIGGAKAQKKKRR
ncbi:MAG TPA: ATP synthase F1 subunit gamma [Candidatus Lachnoclostridium pullistercoris]|uniref:ATP synthase gamma chain n=1 Tax=Candidatus Lachnoclostridium pullistercoris TaxID=2838632 RepID=A0A9D2PDP4_9FIRM|nr:ATP synthase F1 subunit gamma [Candidatus Lachnoclostridium pullistercoris]